MKAFTSLRIILLCFLLVVAWTAHAQEFGSIQGTVTDPSGAVVPSAAVAAVSAETGTTTVVNTNSAGLFVFPSLRPATYSISVTATGFDKYLQNQGNLQGNTA